MNNTINITNLSSSGGIIEIHPTGVWVTAVYAERDSMQTLESGVQTIITGWTQRVRGTLTSNFTSNGVFTVPDSIPNNTQFRITFRLVFDADSETTGYATGYRAAMILTGAGTLRETQIVPASSYHSLGTPPVCMVTVEEYREMSPGDTWRVGGLQVNDDGAAINIGEFSNCYTFLRIEYLLE